MVASVHLSRLTPRELVRAVRGRPRPGRTPGLRFAELTTRARLGPSVLPAPLPGRFALTAVWDDDAALDRWLASRPRLAGDFRVRLEPLRATGLIRAMGPLLDDGERPVADDERVAVLTYARLRPRVAHHFLRASAKAEGRAVADPAMVRGTALAGPPRTVATFSLWRTAAEMRRYAYDRGAHTDAMRAMREHRFHSEYLFARFRPYAEDGTWEG
jgi:heme-degrading monooxygenase HmoA